MVWQYILMMLFWNMKRSIAQDCLRGADDLRFQIPFEDLGSDAPRLPTGSQAVVTSYQFQCCGEITAWQTFMDPGGGMHRDGVYSVNFQVWRPSPTSGGGGGDCYSLVGENRFPIVTLEAGGLLSETPQPTNVISVRPGDVLGYFVTSNRPDGSLPGQGIQLDPSFPNDVVYYADLDAPLTMGTASVGPGGVLSLSINAAPIFSVEISSSVCPPLPPPIMMTSSSTLPTPEPSPTPTLPLPAPETPPTDPTTVDSTIPDPPTAPEEPNPEQPTMATIIIIAPSNTQPTTDAAENSTQPTTALGVDNGPTFLPTVIGVVVTIAILTGSLLTLLVGIAIIRKKIVYKSRLRRSRDMDMQGNEACNLTATSKLSGVTTVVNPAYSCRDGVGTPPHLSTCENQQQDVELTQNQAYVATDIPVEPNQCYAPSSVPDQLYSTVEPKDITHTSTAGEYDYILQ